MSDTTPIRATAARVLWRLAIVALLGAVGGSASWVVASTGEPARSPREPTGPTAAPPGPPPAVEAPDARSPDGQGRDTIDGWATRTGAAIGVPARAVLAYGHAQLRLTAERPQCRLSWATLAGIGSVESNHGRHAGASLSAEGRASPPIVGVPLTGTGGNQAIRDTDRGALDGDPIWDRAVGPMQFIPATWARWGARASADGAQPDPHDLDDAALAAGRYLCASGGNLATADGWWRAVWAYNHSVEYGQLVFSVAQDYARRSAAR